LSGQSRARVGACLALAACTPVTTRPDFLPDPQALVVLLDARPARVAAELPGLLAAESLEVAHANVTDGYVETTWYDVRARRAYRSDDAIADLAATVKIRCWADPYVPGQTRLTVEPVYRPRLDPSRRERDLEVVVPKDHPGYALAVRLLEAAKARFGTPKTGG
jgi:hypothetical protein